MEVISSAAARASHAAAAAAAADDDPWLAAINSLRTGMSIYNRF